MGALDNLAARVDEGLSGFLGSWNAYTSAIATLLVVVVSWQLLTRRDPDIHPILLARQASSSPVRQEGESPVYRAHAAPHGMPLTAGLNVKDPGAAKWARGRDGDLRDIWRRAVAGTPEDAPGLARAAGPKGKGRLLTVLGREQVIEHNLDDVTRQINLIGEHILNQGGNRVAIYLPNSVEFMATLFACSFYNLTAVLLPFDSPEEAVISMLRRSAADTVVTAPGAFPFAAVVKSYPALRQLIWVADEGNRHMDWDEVPQGTGGRVSVATWQDLVADARADAGRALPPLDGQGEPRDITVFWPGKQPAAEEMVRFTSANMVAAVAAQIAAIPAGQRMSPSDLFLPADSLVSAYTLVLTLAALYSNASVAFNSVAGHAADLAAATAGIAPTVLVASPATLAAAHAQATAARLGSALASPAHWLQTRALTSDGVMPAASSLLGRLSGAVAGPTATATATPPGSLRLVLTAERAGAGTPPLSPAALSDLRVYTGARVVYALAAPKVAGAVAQTGFYDYRVRDDGPCSHFGAPLTCAEIYLRDSGPYKTTDDKIEGEIVVRGPSVSGNVAALDVMGKIGIDNTLSYA